MATTTKPHTVARVTGPRYYRSFASYYIPYRPVDELDYAETAGAAYSVAYHDASERIVRFTKVQLVRPSKETVEVPLKGMGAPGAPVYFATAKDDRGNEGFFEGKFTR